MRACVRVCVCVCVCVCAHLFSFFHLRISKLEYARSKLKYFTEQPRERVKILTPVLLGHCCC